MVVARSQVVGADPNREGANILEFETFSEIFISLNGGWEVSGYHFPVDAISCHTTYVKNGSSSCLYNNHNEIGTKRHILPIIFYYIKI